AAADVLGSPLIDWSESFRLILMSGFGMSPAMGDSIPYIHSLGLKIDPGSCLPIGIICANQLRWSSLSFHIYLRSDSGETQKDRLEDKENREIKKIQKDRFSRKKP
ncbi:hypothetical protein ABN235_18920, partial [Morganella morganii]|uniref:hypothetical protein n=1 Tax=Morganella morganii TaxID=582 RepID=UPI0032DB7341